jgi:hypothetical protein
MKLALAAGTILFVIGVLIGMAQLWASPWSADTFLKIEMTIGGLLGIVVVLWFVVKEYQEDKATRSGSRLDE